MEGTQFKNDRMVRQCVSVGGPGGPLTSYSECLQTAHSFPPPEQPHPVTWTICPSRGGIHFLVLVSGFITSLANRLW